MLPRGRSQTKPGSLLKSQIPIRTWAQWDDAVPGFVEIDLVGHDGGMNRPEVSGGSTDWRMESWHVPVSSRVSFVSGPVRAATESMAEGRYPSEFEAIRTIAGKLGIARAQQHGLEAEGLAVDHSIW